MEQDWWKASDTDQYNLKEKLFRVGCRPLKRKYLACKTMASNSIETFGECKVSIIKSLFKFVFRSCLQKIRIEMDECYQMLNYLQVTMAQEQINLNIEKEKN